MYFLVIPKAEIYNPSMGQNRIETLLEAANSSTEHDTSVSSARRTFLSTEEAASFFRRVRANLFRISEWRKNSTATSYELFDASGRPANSDTIDPGKFIRIELHGSGKYDWVHVEEVAEEAGSTILRVKPSHDPTAPDRSDSTSHFFGPEAENNFCVQLNEKSVVFYIIGLNERQNTRDADGLVESARNATVANIGYYSGLQNAVWKDFATNFLRTDGEKSE